MWLGEIICFISTIMAFIYGAHVSFKKKGVLFLQIVTCAFGCFLLGDIYNICYFLCLQTLPRSINIGNLGYIGGALFLLSSYYGAMDRIGDNGGKIFKKYRLISCSALIFNILIYIFSIFYIGKNDFDFLEIIYILIISFVSYFALKHLILPDVEFGILKSMRFYNFLILIFCIMQNLCRVCYYNDSLVVYLKIAVSIIILILMPTAYKGVKKWST